MQSPRNFQKNSSTPYAVDLDMFDVAIGVIAMAAALLFIWLRLKYASRD